MTYRLDIFGFGYDDSLPSLIQFDGGNVLDPETEAAKFVYHRPTRRLIDIEELMEKQARLGYVFPPQEMGYADEWLRENTGIGTPTESSSAEAYLAGFVRFADVVDVTVVLPDWYLMTPIAAAGALAITDGHITLHEPTMLEDIEDITFVVELQVYISQSWGRNVILGMGVDGAPPVEVSRAVFEYAQPTLVTKRYRFDFIPDSTYDFYVSSDFEYAPTSAIGMNMVIAQGT